MYIFGETASPEKKKKKSENPQWFRKARKPVYLEWKDKTKCMR